MPPLAVHRASRAAGLLQRWRGRALVAGLAALLTGYGSAACSSLSHALGLRQEESGASFEVRNRADIGINVYVLPRTALGEIFVGQVGPGRTRTFRLPDSAPGDTVALRATAIDGRPQFARDVLVVGRDAVWQVP